MESQRHYSVGKMFAENIDIESHRKGDLHYVCISLGDNYYETDPYKEESFALSEAKGYLEGLKIKLDIELQNIEKQLNKNE